MLRRERRERREKREERREERGKRREKREKEITTKEKTGNLTLKVTPLIHTLKKEKK